MALELGPGIQIFCSSACHTTVPVLLYAGLHGGGRDRGKVCPGSSGLTPKTPGGPYHKTALKVPRGSWKPWKRTEDPLTAFHAQGLRLRILILLTENTKGPIQCCILIITL